MAQNPASGFNLPESALEDGVFVSSTSGTIALGTETPFILFKNPNASGKTFRLFDIAVGTLQTGGANTLLVKVYSTPTITANGTTVTPVNMRVKASPVASVANVFRAPTTSSNGTLMFQYVLVVNSNTSFLPLESDLYIDANNSVLITLTNSGLNFNVHNDLYWAEI